MKKKKSNKVRKVFSVHRHMIPRFLKSKSHEKRSEKKNFLVTAKKFAAKKDLGILAWLKFFSLVVRVTKR